MKSAIVLAILAALICAPLVFIWSLNTLFDLDIPYTFWTWLAALALGASVTWSKA